jgi:hypothetical protein
VNLDPEAGEDTISTKPQIRPGTAARAAQIRASVEAPRYVRYAATHATTITATAKIRTSHIRSFVAAMVPPRSIDPHLALFYPCQGEPIRILIDERKCHQLQQFTSPYVVLAWAAAPA